MVSISSNSAQVPTSDRPCPTQPIAPAIAPTLPLTSDRPHIHSFPVSSLTHFTTTDRLTRVIPSVSCLGQEIRTIVFFDPDGTEELIGMAIELLPSHKWSASSVRMEGKVFATEKEAVQWIERIYWTAIESLDAA